MKSQKRLVFIVEGDTEIVLVDKLIVPYLYKKNLTNPMYAQTIVSNRKQHKKGGVVSYAKFRNEVERTLAQGNVIVTTLIDFFRLPTDFPNYSTNSSKIHEIEQGISADFNHTPNLLPYIQRHELEALMFASRAGFELVIDAKEQHKLNQIDDILKNYPNPEDINNQPETAPSKRLEKIFGYEKIADGELIFEMIGVETMLQKCPRFAAWITKIIAKLQKE
jgi:hypothetical protein